MRVTINEHDQQVPSGSSVADLIRRFESPEAVLIVEVDGRYVHPRDYERRIIAEGENVDMYHPIFGG